MTELLADRDAQLTALTAKLGQRSGEFAQARVALEQRVQQAAELAESATQQASAREADVAALRQQLQVRSRDQARCTCIPTCTCVPTHWCPPDASFLLPIKNAMCNNTCCPL